MKLYVVFAQRKQRYDGQYAPEAVAVVTEFDRDENPDWIQDTLANTKADADILNAEIFEIDLGGQAIEQIRARLIDYPKMTGTIV